MSFSSSNRLGGNPFYSDDVEDDAFLRHPPSGNSGYMFSSNTAGEGSYSDNLEEKRQELLRRRREIEERSLSSTERSLSYLKNSEQVGIAAAEELLRQREQLERTERSLDNINTTLRFSQKHIRGIKSVFGGLRNYFSGKQNEPIPELSTSPGPSSLSERLDMTTAAPKDHQNSHIGLSLRGQVQAQEKPTDHQTRINSNLDDMLGNIHRLKGLAHGLGEEIESHNHLIESVIDKTEKADDTIRRQNKDISKLLK